MTHLRPFLLPSIAASIAVLLAAFILLSACGDDGGGAGISTGDLPQIILQSEDVPFAVQLEPVVQGDANSDAYGVQFEVPQEDAAAGETACVSAALALYPSPSKANDAFESVVTSINQLITASTPAHTVERTSTHLLGEESDAFRTTSQATSFCSSFAAVPMEGYTFYFRDGEVLATLAVYNLDSGADLNDAIQLAEAQQSRIEQFRASDP